MKTVSGWGLGVVAAAFALGCGGGVDPVEECRSSSSP